MNIELTILLNAMQEAGAAIMALQKTGFSIQHKHNNDLLTQADLAANDILKAHLTQHFPDIGWLSEESIDEPLRLAYDRVWIVDPIDGTIEFAAGIPEFAISVALVEKGQPIVAAVYNPVTQELFYAARGQGAWLGEQRLYCKEAVLPSLQLLASRSEYQRGEWACFESTHHVQVVGSIAYKLALIAAGRADATFSLSPKSEWDIAAGVLLVTEAGGVVTDKTGVAFIFNQKNCRVNGIVAASAAAEKSVFEMISTLPVHHSLKGNRHV